MIKIIRYLLALAVAGYVAAVGYLYIFQDGMIFPAPDDVISEQGDDYFKEIRIETPDGETLFALHHPPEDDEATIIVFHGNAHAAYKDKPRGRKLADAGFGVLLAEYRGYPGSTGQPSEEGLFTDVVAIFDHLAKDQDAKIGLYGHSLGSGVSTYLATQRDVFALVLEGPFDALAAVAADRYPWIPVWSLIKHKFNSYEYIQELDEPILIMHGDLDRTVPIKHGERLYSVAPEGTEFIEIKGGQHSDLEDFGSEEKAIDFFKKALEII